MQKDTEFPQEQENDHGIVSRDLVEKYLYVSADECPLSGVEKERFIATAIAYQLNPFKRELHMKVSADEGNRKFQLIVGYEVYIKKAERTGLLDGWKAWIEGTGEILKAVIEIQRKDWKNPFVHEVYWSEAVQRKTDGTIFEFWARMPRFQLKKVVISQGFRLCFCDEIGGMPYEGAELPVQESNASGIEKPGPNPSVNNPHPLNSCGAATPSKPSTGNLAKDIHERAMANKDILSPQHLEWIENQLRMEKNEAQLYGLMKHLEETIAAGGDDNDSKTRSRSKTTNPRMPGIVKRPRVPASYQRPVIPQDVPIF